MWTVSSKPGGNMCQATAAQTLPKNTLRAPSLSRWPLAPFVRGACTSKWVRRWDMRRVTEDWSQPFDRGLWFLNKHRCSPLRDTRRGVMSKMQSLPSPSLSHLPPRACAHSVWNQWQEVLDRSVLGPYLGLPGAVLQRLNQSGTELRNIKRSGGALSLCRAFRYGAARSCRIRLVANIKNWREATK